MLHTSTGSKTMMHSLVQSLPFEPKKSERSDLVENHVMNDLSDALTVHLTVETIEETTILRKAIGSVLHATTIISHGEPNATVVEKARMVTSKPTSHPLETTTVPITEESAHVKKTMDATIGNAHHVATTTSHSERNATNVVSQKQAEEVKDVLVEVSQIEGNEVVATQIDVEAVVMDDEVPETAVVAEIQIAVAVAETVGETLVETVVAGMIDVIQVEDVQTVTEIARTNAIEKPVENAPVMLTIEDLNPSVHADIRTKIETIEVR
ncbi:MAG: hypothetical protein ACO3NJ_00540 [Candidatus Poseidoniaceae archaeon]